MKIIDIEPIVLTLPLQNPVVTSFGSMNTRTGIYVKVHTDTGEFGIGEVWNNFPSWGIYEKIATLNYGMKPLLIGEDPRNIRNINNKLFSSCEILGLQWGATGPIYQSISGIDLALWDLLGKHCHKPVYKLLGGGNVSEIEVYASGLGPTGFETLVEKHKEMGIKRFKLKVGTGLDKDLAHVKKMREILDIEDQLMIDANQGWDRRTAIEHLNQLNQFQLSWVEEPVRCDDLEGLKIVRDATGLCIAAGENFYGRKHALQALNAGAIDVIQPDLSKNGGITESRIVAEMAHSWEVPYAPHFLSGAVCFAASLHFMASVPDGMILELDANPNPLREKLFTKPFVVNKGKIAVPDKPGFGFELDEEFVNYYRIDLDEL
ncbi:mandelate racemase/muconate lactonizing enzyme family protein [Lentibacillus sp. N15]|uniref:mandelate racemase/muconate lactonizing enzyme family protein n=1 Tax=Lentibacillus songyuanensis TaxID=3136161 RepID=UPI0031BB6CC9